MNDRKKELLLTRLHFFIFGATIVGETAVTSLVVSTSSQGAAILSKLNMINGIILFLLPTILFKKIDRVNRGELFRKVLLIASLIIFTMVAVFHLNSGAHPSLSNILLLLFYPISYLLKSVLFFTFWTVATDISDVTETKQMFPEVAAFGFLGGLSGALFARILLINFSPLHILFFWGVLYVVAYRVASKVITIYGARMTPQESLPTSRKDKKSTLIDDIRSIFGMPLVRNIAYLYFATFVTIFLMDYYFWMQCSKVYSNPTDLTSFQFTFYMIHSLVTISTLRYLTPNLIAERGFTRVFSYMPRIILGGTLICGFLSLLPIKEAPLFRIFLIWQLLRYVAFENFFSPVYQMFFAAIGQEKRGRAKTVIEGVVKPTAIIFSSLSLMLFQDIRWLILSAIALSSLMMVVVARKIKIAYMMSLTERTNSQGVSVSSIIKGIGTETEQRGLTMVEKIAAVDSDDMQQFAVDMLLALNRADSTALLEEYYDRGRREINRRIAAHCGELNPLCAKKIVNRCIADDDSEIRALAFRSLALEASLLTEFHKEAHLYFHMGEEVEKFAVSLYIWQKGSRADRTWISNYLQSMSTHAKYHAHALMTQAELHISTWRSDLITELQTLSLPFYKRSLDLLLPNCSPDELDVILSIIDQIKKKERQRLFFKRIVLIPLYTIPTINEYIGNATEDTLFVRGLIKALIRYREKVSIKELPATELQGLWNFARARCIHAYLLAGVYYKILELGQRYNIRESITALFEEALQNHLIEAADVALDTLVVLEGFPYLIEGRKEFSVHDKGGRISLIEVLETLDDSDVKDMAIPILEGSSWDVYYEVGQRFIEKVDRDSSHFLDSDDPWIVFLALNWHYEYLHDSPHEERVKEIVLALQRSKWENISTLAKTVETLWQPGAVMANSSIDILEKIFFLKQCELFKLVPAEKMMTLAETTELVEYSQGDCISHQGDIANHIYLMREGIAEVRFVRAQKEILLGRLEEGDFYGESGLFRRAPRVASVVALSDCQVYVFSRGHLKKMVATTPELAINLLEVYEGKLEEYHQNLLATKEKCDA